jgi:RNA polymerase sigma-70 factor, ECF subfamily
VSVVRVNNEAELVRRIVAGDSHAEEEVVHRYKEGVSVIIGRIVQNRSATEDISQETFKITIEKMRRGDVREPERLSGFICGVARNLAIDHVRRVRKSTNQEDVGITEHVSDPTPDPYEQLWRKERARIVRGIINELRVKRDRDVILRYYIAEEDKEQICADLGLSREQFNGVIFRALKRYKELYEKLVGKG